MNGKGRWAVNVFVERFWRSLKYEEVYQHAYATVSTARTGIGDSIDFFNQLRPHSRLNCIDSIRYTSTACRKLWRPEPRRSWRWK